ncbi:HAMP domain-containing sensor histidine kinase [Sphingobium nicotianae]|uniref:histidine kinase n=1 Tax=Sphingobium nicotianae TaxID=2782607 RepID=A0A9X1ISC0_9SPHN|nr:HAMP domain-containing sensor histidine kinase [Sphingobium nicotianae]MBT2188293.1 HAMP domain-containing histidine kinase [Sphingobium nicotianae]
MTVQTHRVGRLAIEVGFAFAVAMLGVGIIGFGVADAWVSNRIDASLRHHTAKYLGSLDGSGATDRAVAAKIVDWQRRKILSERTYLLFRKDGTPVAGRLDIAPPAPGFSNVEFLGGGTKYQSGRALATKLRSGSLFVIVQHSEAAASLNALLPQVVLSISMVALVMGVGATFLFAHLTASRLAETQSTADAIAAGDLSHRIPMDRLDGIFAVQAESLNRMLDRMEELVRAQRLFSSNLAHDLRTPLTRLRSLLARGVGHHDQNSSSLFENADRECLAIINIFDALLRLAEIETGRHPSNMASLALRPLIEDVVDTMEPVIADHGSRLELGRLDDVTISGDPDLINQLLVNLLENVATHTPSGTSAMLSLARDAGDAVITICDNGPGLPAADLARVTQAFQRGSASAKVRGSGLGLAIARAIARFHKGSLDLSNRWPGLEVRVHIPANDGIILPVDADSAAA